MYVASISNYSAIYGSLAAIIVLLMRIYLSAYVLLISALLNSELERQNDTGTIVGEDKFKGARGTVMADNNLGDEAVRLIAEKRDLYQRQKIAVKLV